MAALDNPRHERFAQALAEGMSATDAYVWAGFKANDGNASRLKGNERVVARLAELTAKGAERAEVTVERVVRELAKIGFSDIRKVVKWSGSELLDEVDGKDGEGGEPQLIVRAANLVCLVNSEDIDDETAGCISEVSQSKEGALKVKLHDKRAALVDLGKHLGMFKERVEHTGSDGGPIELADVSDRDRARAMMLLASRVTSDAERAH